jgi:hypothetical protein
LISLSLLLGFAATIIAPSASKWYDLTFSPPSIVAEVDFPAPVNPHKTAT